MRRLLIGLIVLSLGCHKHPRESLTLQAVEGIVLDSTSNRPVSAAVVIAGAQYSTLTDSAGKFTLDVNALEKDSLIQSSPFVKLVIRKFGYSSESVSVRATQPVTSLTVRLSRDTSRIETQ